MASLHRQPRRVSTTLVREATDWGVAVSEKRVRSSWRNGALLILSVCALFCGLLLVLPLLVGLMLSAEINQLGMQAAIVASIVGLAIVFNIQSRRGPRNALELDQNASQLRLGFKNRYGAFVRQRVIPLSQVEDASVRESSEGQPELNIAVGGEQIQIALAEAKEVRLIDIAAQIREAADIARNAPRRSRIQSTIAGLGASYREIGNRVASRVIH